MLIPKPTGALLAFAGLALSFTLPSCSTNKDSGLVAAGSSTSTGAQGGSGNSGSAPSGDTGGVVSIIVGEGGTAGTTSTMVACTEGEDCTCPTVSVAVLGKPGQYGDKDTTAFMNWLNSSSAGTAKVDSYTDRQILTADFLAPYNVVILLGLGDDSDKGPFWTYEASELTAIQDWVTAGGGLLTLSGAAGSGDEVKPQNQLLEFTGISYAMDGFTPSNCPFLDANGSAMCWCIGGPMPIIPSDFNTTDTVVAGLATGITSGVGLHVARSITAPADAHIAAAVTTNGSMVYNALVGKVVGSGRVLVFADEWITYTSQWNATATQANCEGYMPPDVFQTAQIWFNMIKWAQPAATCFKIVGTPDQEVIIW